jgi:hypothetical protein
MSRRDEQQKRAASPTAFVLLHEIEGRASLSAMALAEEHCAAFRSCGDLAAATALSAQIDGELAALRNAFASYVAQGTDPVQALRTAEVSGPCTREMLNELADGVQFSIAVRTAARGRP